MSFREFCVNSILYIFYRLNTTVNFRKAVYFWLDSSAPTISINDIYYITEKVDTIIPIYTHIDPS